MLYTFTQRVMRGVFNWLLFSSLALTGVPAHAALTDGLIAYLGTGSVQYNGA